jgi:exodeoxyribonuclease VII large subunit
MAQIYSIEELTNSINTLINSKYTGQILVKGEITNFKISRNNAFFGLKNENSFISCNYFQCYDVEDIQNGSLVVVTANVSIYSRFGKYNLNVSEIKPVGTGNIHQKYLEIKKNIKSLDTLIQKIKRK